MDILINRGVLAVGAGAALAAILLGATAYNALSVREPPLEATNDAGLRIRLVAPPRAPLKAGDRLGVGLPEVAGALDIASRSSATSAAPPRARRLSQDQDLDRPRLTQTDDGPDEAFERADLAEREAAWRERRARRWPAEEQDRISREEQRAWGARVGEPDGPGTLVERYAPSPEDLEPPRQYPGP